MEGDVYKIQIGEHEFITPPEPPHKEILFWNKPKKDQYWTRQTDFPAIFFDWHNDQHSLGVGVDLDAANTKYHPDDKKILISLSKEDTASLFDKFDETGKDGYQEREMRRRTEGLWFYNNGEPTYLTGNHYFCLQWGAFLGCSNSVEPNSSYGQYYQFQRDYLYYFEICKSTPYGRGGTFIKPKKTGATQVFSLVALNEATTHKEKNIRIMSITESLAKESNFALIKYAMQKMPNILMPSRSKLNEGECVFGPANSSRNPLKKRKETNLQPLNTWLTTVSTSKTAFDSFTNYLALIDEWPKIKENTYPKELFDVTVETVREGFLRKGTIFALSYVPEHSDRSFYEARVIYKGGKLKTRKQDEAGNYYGEVQSKLICWTLTIEQGMFNCCDQYGKPIEEKIRLAIRQEQEDARRDPVNAAQKLQSIKRQYPEHENDAWSEASREDALFDNLRLDDQMQAIEDMLSTGNPPYVQFNLEYLVPPIKKKEGTGYDFSNAVIIYKELTHDQIMKGEVGDYRWYDKDLTPDWFMNKNRGGITKDKKTGSLKPNENSLFFVSIDPTSYRMRRHTAVGSLNAMYGFILPDAELNSYCGADVTNKRPFIEYHQRKDSPNDTLHDFIKLFLWLGCMVQIESDQATWATDLIEMGLGHFILMLNSEGALEPWTGRADQKLFTMKTITIDQVVNATQKHLEAPKQGDADTIKQIKSIKLLEQLQSIRKEDTRDYDSAVSYMEGIMGINSWLGWRRAQEEIKKKRGSGMAGMAAAILMR